MKTVVKTYEEMKDIVEPLVESGKYIVSASSGPEGYVIQQIEQKFYTAHEDGKEYPDEAWMTKEGEIFNVQDIPLDHCRNILRMMIRQERKAKELLSELMKNIGSEDDGDGEDVDQPEVVPVADKVLH